MEERGARDEIVGDLGWSRTGSGRRGSSVAKSGEALRGNAVSGWDTMGPVSQGSARYIAYIAAATKSRQ